MSDEAARARAEWRADEEDWSRAALEQWEHGRALTDVVRDCMRRGDTVTFAYAAHSWTGTVVAVGADIARVDTGSVRVDIRLVPDAPFVLRARASNQADDHAGVDADGLVTSFTGRLREVDGTAVCIGTAMGPLEGCVRIGRDQVRVTDAGGGVAYVPAGSVWWVRPLADD